MAKETEYLKTEDRSRSNQTQVFDFKQMIYITLSELAARQMVSSDSQITVDVNLSIKRLTLPSFCTALFVSSL